MGVSLIGDVAFFGDDNRDLGQLQSDLCDTLNNTCMALICGGFPFSSNGVVHVIQSRSQDQANVLGLNSLAQAAIAGGAQPGNFRWLDPNSDFAFIDAANNLIPLDAQGMSSLFQAGVAYKSALTFAAFNAKAAVNAANSISDAQAAFAAVIWP